MLTVELKGVPDLPENDAEFEIYCDQQGLRELKRQIDFLFSGETHVHLKTESWAGNELTEQKQIASNTLVNHLRITLKRE